MAGSHLIGQDGSGRQGGVAAVAPQGRVLPVPGSEASINEQPDIAGANPAQGESRAPTVPAVLPVAEAPAPLPKAPKRGQRIWPWVAGAVVAAGIGGLLYLQPWVPTATPVVVEVVAAGPVTRVLAVNGRIEGVQSVDVRPQVSGTVTEVLVAEGDVVAAGAALARIDPATQQAVERQALAALDAALVAEAEAQAVYARTQALGTNAARVVLDSAARAVQSAMQEVARMTALLDQAQIQLAKYTIRAPLAGTVLVMTAEPGQSVDPATVLMTITDLTHLVVETDVDESYATQIRLGQPAALQLSGETEVRAGHVSFVSQRVDETTGGLAVELSPDAALAAPVGLTVTANITVDDRAEAITVPRTALVDGGVLVVVDGMAERRAVEVIDWPAARLIVTGGLATGDVVIADATGVAPGQAVAVLP